MKIIAKDNFENAVRRRLFLAWTARWWSTLICRAVTHRCRHSRRPPPPSKAAMRGSARALSSGSNALSRRQSDRTGERRRQSRAPHRFERGRAKFRQEPRELCSRQAVRRVPEVAHLARELPERRKQRKQPPRKRRVAELATELTAQENAQFFRRERVPPEG